MTEETRICARCGAEGADTTAAADPCPSCGGDPRLDGRYQLLARVGHGAIGTTYRTQRLSDGLIVAIKELLVRRLDTFKSEELFHREAAALRTLEHPGVPRCLDSFSAGDGRHLGFYLVLEFIEGQTLAEQLQDHRFSEAEVLDLLDELLGTLGWLHDQSPPIVHRDIKPSNVMRRPDGRLVLIDFGAVREVTREAGVGGSTVAGTFGYMAPELFAGIALPASDLYALGVLAVELLSRRPPQQLIDEDNRLAWQDAVRVSPGMKHLLGRLLEPQRQRRLQTAAEARDLIARHREGQLHATPAQRPAAPAVIPPPPPPAPRGLPHGLLMQAAPVATLLFWHGVGLGSIGALLALLLPVYSIDAALSFGVMALPPLLLGARTRREVRRLYRDGEVAEGVVERSALNLAYRVNGRSPVAIHFRYDVNGVTYQDANSRWLFRTVKPGDRIYALYLPNRPERALLLPISGRRI